MIHIAIVRGEYAEPILIGTKTIESRLTKTRKAPFGRIRIGERIYFKKSSGPFFATAIVSAVHEFESLTEQLVEDLRELFDDRVLGGDVYWSQRSGSRFAVFVELDRVEPVGYGPSYRDLVAIGSRDAWHVLSDERCVYDEAVRGFLAFE